MSNIQLIIEERPSDIGNFLVGRLLPFIHKRTVGPFIFIDHMGPTCLSDTKNLDIPPHPHIGLSTLTYLLEGSIMHKDSLGTEIEITPGQVNWMTAGRGVVHSERTPEYLRSSDKFLHGLQIWISLPKELEEMEPSFQHVEESGLPQWVDNGIEYKLIAGEFAGKKSDVTIFSPLYFIEIKSKERKTVTIGKDLFGESALYIMKGGIESDGNIFEPKQLLVAKNSTLCEFDILPESIVYIFGGEPFPEERYIFWNFVASRKDLIEEAKEKWKNQEFDKVPGESDFVPLPSLNKK